MQLTNLLPFISILSITTASAVLPPNIIPNTNTTGPNRPIHPRSYNAVADLGDPNNPSYSRCQYHTNVRQECQEGKLNTYVSISRFYDEHDSFQGWSGAPTVGVAPSLYLPGVTIVGPKLKKSNKARFETTWYGDHMWYSYNGPSWSDNDKKSCNKGAWTAGPLMCDKPGTLSWRVSG